MHVFVISPWKEKFKVLWGAFAESLVWFWSSCFLGRLRKLPGEFCVWAWGGGRLMLCIFLGMVMWQRLLVHEKGICAFEEPKMSETAEYRVRGLSRGLYRTLQETLRFLSSQGSPCLQPGERGREVGWGPRVEAGRYIRTRWCGLV